MTTIAVGPLGGDAETALVGDSWDRVDLGAFLAVEFTPTCPSILKLSGGTAIFYPGHVCGLHADSGIGKTWVAVLAVKEQLQAGEHVIVIDLEEPTPTTWIGRLRQVGVSDEVIAAGLHYYSPTDEFTDESVGRIVADVEKHQVPIVVLDSIGEAFGLCSIDENKDSEVGPWLRRVARRIADAGACVVLIDHSTKAQDNPLHPSGSKRKRAAITGASYLVEAPVPLTRDQGGRLTLTCAKDRHGNFRRGQLVATIDFTVYPDGGMTVHAWPVLPTGPRGADAKLQIIARAAVRAAKELDRPASQRALISTMNVKAARDTKIAGIEHAVALGALRVETGPRNSSLHCYVRDLDD